MRILKDFNIPDFKFPKFKMKNVENIDEMKVDYEAIEKKQKEGKGKNKGFEPSNFKTIKEVFIKSREKFADNTFILEKINPKEEFEEITYKQFCNDVIALGTALTNKYNLKDERIVIIGETTYNWYVSYTTLGPIKEA